MDDDSLLKAVEAEGSRFYDVARGAQMALRVPACPEWTIEDLVSHVGKIHHWVARLVEAGEPREGMGFPDIPAGAEALPWAEDGFNAMLSAFREKGPDAPCWNFGKGTPRVVRWWYRRQALETAVHRYDIETASGLDSSPVDPELAVEGVDEMLCEMLPVMHRRGATKEMHGTLHLHATDADGEWWVDFSSEEPVAIREHKKADTALRGPASGLYLWLWNRQTPDEAGLEVFGPDAAVAAWRTVTI